MRREIVARRTGGGSVGDIVDDLDASATGAGVEAAADLPNQPLLTSCLTS